MGLGGWYGETELVVPRRKPAADEEISGYKVHGGRRIFFGDFM